MPPAPTVAWISIAPVKAMALQSLTEAVVTPQGIPGDRRFAILDAASDRLINGKRLGPLATIHPTVSPDGTHLALRFPDGTTAAATVERTHPIDGIFFGRTRATHGLAGPFDGALTAFAGTPLRLVELDTRGTGTDRAELGAGISIATVAGLAELAHAGGREDPLDPRRFRMTFGVDGVPPFADDAWLGREVRIGTAVVRPEGNVGRCATTTYDPDVGRPDFDTLRILNDLRGHLETTEPLAFGVWGTVLVPGHVRLGDPVDIG